MDLVQLKTLINILATFMGIIVIVLIYGFPQHAILILSLEVIILPTIYIIGNSYIEERIKEKYQQIISDISDDTEKLKERYVEQVLKNQELKIRLKTK